MSDLEKLKPSQRAVLAVEMMEADNGLTTDLAAKRVGIGHTIVDRALHIKKKDPEALDKIKHGTLTVGKVYHSLRGHHKKERKHLPDGLMKPEDAELLLAPSIYPEDARIPQGQSDDEKRLRFAISELREHELKISFYGMHKLNELIYPNTQFIQAYAINRFEHPRPDGALDPRLLDWCRNVAERMLIQRRRKQIDRELDRRQEPKSRPIETGFDLMWKNYWRQEAVLLRKLSAHYFPQIKERWLERATEIFRQKQNNAERLRTVRKERVAVPEDGAANPMNKTK